MGATALPFTRARPACRVEVTCADDISESLRVAWGDLASDAAEPNSFMEPWFAVPSLAMRGKPPVRVLSAWNSGVLIGVMLVTTATRYGRIPMSHTTNWQSVQSFYGAPLIRNGHAELFWTSIFEALDHADWAPSFLSVAGLEENGAAHVGLLHATRAMRRDCATVHRQDRAKLASGLTPEAYLDAALRAKKRKELRRLTNRLGELGVVKFSALTADDTLDTWIDDFLALESAGWKGTRGAAFANTPESAAFLRTTLMGAHKAGVLDFLRLDLDGRAVAMLINFIRPPGSFSFKIAYDENLARFSPGILIEIENLKRFLTNPKVLWMDSCAQENHPMINSLWMERRALVQVSVPLRGTKRRVIYRVCRSLESMSASVRKFQTRWSRR